MLHLSMLRCLRTRKLTHRASWSVFVLAPALGAVKTSEGFGDRICSSFSQHLEPSLSPLCARCRGSMVKGSAKRLKLLKFTKNTNQTGPVSPPALTETCPIFHRLVVEGTCPIFHRLVVEGNCSRWSYDGKRAAQFRSESRTFNNNLDCLQTVWRSVRSASLETMCFRNSTRECSLFHFSGRAVVGAASGSPSRRQRHSYFAQVGRTGIHYFVSESS